MESDWVTEGLPGEFEPQAALVLGLHQVMPFYPHVLLDIAKALIDRIAMIGIVYDEAQRRQAITLLSDWGLPAQLVHFVSMPLQGAWVRDYGPGFVRTSRGEIALVDADYTVRDRFNDDRFPLALASLLHLPAIHAPLVLEGGNLMSNGRGFGITSLRLYWQNQARGYDESYVQRLLTMYYGLREGITLTPLAREETGHIDMFATFTSPNTVVVGQYSPAADPENASILDENASLLASVQSGSGRFNVVRVPMPDNHDGVFRTYTNVVFANGRLLMPSYPNVDRHLEDQAAATFARLLPGWQIIRIDCSGIIREQGALHCMVLNVPWLTDRFPAPGSYPRQRRRKVLVPAPHAK